MIEEAVKELFPRFPQRFGSISVTFGMELESVDWLITMAGILEVSGSPVPADRMN